MERKTIGFIGAGKMAEALIGGLISKGVFEAGSIIACAPSEKTRNHVAGTYGIEMFATAAEVTSRADLLVLAVKPKHVLGVLSEEGVEIGAGKTLISIVAGLTIDALKSNVPDCKIIRVMPNHCCMVLEGAMGYSCDPSVDAETELSVQEILSAVGLAVKVDESFMDAITGVAGSSPAFMYLVLDAMASAGVLNGLSYNDSIRLAAQSMLGAAKMVLETGKHPDILRDEVCSPGGTTIEGVRTMEDMGVRSAMIAAVDDTIEKSRRMSGN
ncbi:MAG: pyrroline-5-carboxylate reductase [Candidatus Methanomethylophilaceae archaeon]|nr:pyrroline-5-carboxylate reductase [Candidatus Methanomethylophilaceae archaeon]